MDEQTKQHLIDIFQLLTETQECLRAMMFNLPIPHSIDMKNKIDKLETHISESSKFLAQV